ncbi:MAG TPA: ABC transporter permease subunit [Candidatus Limnocylindrales bacterium]|nr:ABC transporter permease subunit [Candidatus Limnocylindrales bacterium]
MPSAGDTIRVGSRRWFLQTGMAGMAGLSLPALIAGAAITETIFSWPGLGFLGIAAVGQRDYPIIMAFVLLGGIAVVLGNLFADVLYGIVDPRIKY